jgi:hypothetical protein
VDLTASAAPFVGDVLATAFEAAQAVVVLMTPDDLAQLRPDLRAPNDLDYETRPSGQARPDVLFEAGMALGLHPERTVIVELGRLRPFSDIGGRHVIRFDGSASSRQALLTKLADAGCEVDKKGSDWLTSGVFTVPVLDGEAAGDGTGTADLRSERTESSPQLTSEPHLAAKATRSGSSRYRLVITNRGPGTARNLSVKVSDDLPLLIFDEDLPLNELPEGESAVVPVADIRTNPGNLKFKVDVSAEFESLGYITRNLDCSV